MRKGLLLPRRRGQPRGVSNREVRQRLRRHLSQLQWGLPPRLLLRRQGRRELAVPRWKVRRHLGPRQLRLHRRLPSRQCFLSRGLRISQIVPSWQVRRRTESRRVQNVPIGIFCKQPERSRRRLSGLPRGGVRGAGRARLRKLQTQHLPEQHRRSCLRKLPCKQGVFEKPVLHRVKV